MGYFIPVWLDTAYSVLVHFFSCGPAGVAALTMPPCHVVYSCSPVRKVAVRKSVVVNSPRSSYYRRHTLNQSQKAGFTSKWWSVRSLSFCSLSISLSGISPPILTARICHPRIHLQMVPRPCLEPRRCLQPVGIGDCIYLDSYPGH